MVTIWGSSSRVIPCKGEQTSTRGVGVRVAVGGSGVNVAVGGLDVAVAGLVVAEGVANLVWLRRSVGEAAGGLCVAGVHPHRPARQIIGANRATRRATNPEFFRIG